MTTPSIESLATELEADDVKPSFGHQLRFQIRDALQRKNLALIAKPTPEGESFDTAPKDGTWIIMMHPSWPGYGEAVRWDRDWWLCPAAGGYSQRDAAINREYPNWIDARWVPAVIDDHYKISAEGDAVFIANKKRVESILFDEMVRSRA